MIDASLKEGKTQRKVINQDGFSKREVKGIVNLYNALVPEKTWKFYNLQAGDRYFKDWGSIDIKAIYEKAFPRFEEILGRQIFQKVKKHFGIEGIPKKYSQTEKELAKLKTMENARYYIKGYNELIETIASKLEGAPKEMADIEKVKLLRAYYRIMTHFQYFPEDYIPFGSRGIDEPNFQILMENEKMEIGPEQLIFLYLFVFVRTMPNSIHYEIIKLQIEKLSKKTLKEFLDFAELDSNFNSINVCSSFKTFSQLRKIKKEIFPKLEGIQKELFAIEACRVQLIFDEMYKIYKELKYVSFEDFEDSESNYKIIQGFVVKDQKDNVKRIAEKYFIVSANEQNNYIQEFEIIVMRNMDAYAFKSSKDKKLGKPEKIETKSFMGAIMFAMDSRYIDKATTVSEDFKIARELLKKAKSKKAKLGFEDYWDKKISTFDLKDKLGIDRKFEHEKLGFSEEKTPFNVIGEFLIKRGYIKEISELDETKILENLYLGKEENFLKFTKGEISEEEYEETFEKGRLFIFLIAYCKK